MEEADYQATAELFGAKTEAKSVDIFIPKSESDFLEYAEMISRKLVPYEVIPYSLSRLSYLINNYQLLCTKITFAFFRRKAFTILGCSKQ